MFKPNRLIYREMRDTLTEGPGELLEKVLLYAPNTVERANEGIKSVISGVRKAVTGVFKAGDEAIESTWRNLKRATWDGVAAPFKSLFYGGWKTLKSLTYDNYQIMKRDGFWGLLGVTKNTVVEGVGKNFFGSTVLGTVAGTAKGLANIGIAAVDQVALAPLRTAGHLVGVGRGDSGGMEFYTSHGLLPTVGAAAKGVGQIITSPLPGGGNPDFKKGKFTISTAPAKWGGTPPAATP